MGVRMKMSLLIGLTQVELFWVWSISRPLSLGSPCLVLPHSFAVEKAVVHRKGPLPNGQYNSNRHSDRGTLTVLNLQNRYFNLVVLMYVEFFLPL
jgi:hypothetical protein